MRNAITEDRNGGPLATGGPDERLTVVLAHDRSRTRDDIREALESDGFHVSADADSARELVEEVLNREPQICLLDVDLPGGSIQAIEEIVAGRPGTTIAILTDSTARKRVLRAICAGAHGVLSVRTPPAEVPAVVRAVWQGEHPLPRAVTKSLDEELQELARPRSTEPPRSSLRYTLLYVPRFVRHVCRRLRSRWPLGEAWASSRERMHSYR
jgi:DNA-binding NarL/FixJ family response regulator